MVIDSVPPATITCADPPRIRSAAIAIACKPEEQNRLIVIAEVSIGNPARSAAIRATFIPCSPSGIAQPRITSSISLASNTGTRASASLIASAAKSSGRVARNDPLKAFPTGVRTEETITASVMATSQNRRLCYCWTSRQEKQITGTQARQRAVSDCPRVYQAPRITWRLFSSRIGKSCRLPVAQTPHIRRERGHLVGRKLRAAHCWHRAAKLFWLGHTLGYRFLDSRITPIAPQPFLARQIWTQN